MMDCRLETLLADDQSVEDQKYFHCYKVVFVFFQPLPRRNQHDEQGYDRYFTLLNMKLKLKVEIISNKIES